MKKIFCWIVLLFAFLILARPTNANEILQENFSGPPGNIWTPSFFTLFSKNPAIYNSDGVIGNGGDADYTYPSTTLDGVIKWAVELNGNYLGLVACRDSSDFNSEERIAFNGDGTANLQWYYNGGGTNGPGINIGNSGKHIFELDCIGNSLTLKEDNQTIISSNTNWDNTQQMQVIRLDLSDKTTTLTSYQYCDSSGCLSQNPQPHLSVTPFKQNSGGWENMTYDLANIWSPANPSIGTWGCALTSAAMVLNYYNIHTVPQSNLSMTPGNLDAWLGIQPDGYVPNGNVNWLAIQRLTKQAKADNPNFIFDALEYKRSNFADTTTLLADLNAGQPDILEEPGHFVVATGQNGSTYTINDPYYNRTDLTSYGNTFLSLGRYIPSFTNLSYMLFTSDPSLTVTLKDNTNTPVGTSYTQQPLHGAGTNLIAGNPINLLYFQNPDNGNYTLTVSGTSNQLYTIKGFLYDTNGNVQPFTQTGTVNVDNPNTVAVSFNPENLRNDSTTKIVSVTTFINDLTNLYKLKDIKIIPYATLNGLGKALETSIGKKNKVAAKMELNLISAFLKVEKGKGVDNTAYQILSQDIQYLQTH